MNTFAIQAFKEERTSIADGVILLKMLIARHHKDLANLDGSRLARSQRWPLF